MNILIKIYEEVLDLGANCKYFICILFKHFRCVKFETSSSFYGIICIAATLKFLYPIKIILTEIFFIIYSFH